MLAGIRRSRTQAHSLPSAAPSTPPVSSGPGPPDAIIAGAEGVQEVPTHHQWEAPVFRIEFVETQVDDERSYGVEEGKDAQGHEELGGGREVSHEVHGLGGGFIITEGHLILDPVQPAGGMKPTLSSGQSSPRASSRPSLPQGQSCSSSRSGTLAEPRGGHVGRKVYGGNLGVKTGISLEFWPKSTSCSATTPHSSVLSRHSDPVFPSISRTL